jgi:hypothetical protein
MKMSETRDLANARALARLTKALPEIFPKPVLTYALNRRWTPPMPRLAVDGYWRAHPLRADRLARALARRSGTPDGWTWRLKEGRKSDLPASFAQPPAPYREKRFSRGPGFCCVCGQPVYRLGWHEDLWERGANRNATWHTACVVSWRLWNAPSDYAKLLRRLQQRRCAETGARLWKTCEVDHRVPLFRSGASIATWSGPCCFRSGVAESAGDQSRCATRRNAPPRLEPGGALSFLPLVPRKRRPSPWRWIPACAGMSEECLNAN